MASTDHLVRNVYVQDGFITPDVAAQLRASVDPFRDTAGFYQAVYPETFDSLAPPDDRNLFLSVAERVADRLREVFGDPTLLLETRILVMMRTGSEHTPHADSEYETEPGVWQPNHTPNRTHAGLLYLTTDGDDHEGGVLHVAGREVPSKPGRLAMFPSTRDYVHWVTPITSGERVSMSVWTVR